LSSSVWSNTENFLFVTGFINKCVIPDFRKNFTVSADRNSFIIITTGATDFIDLNLVAKSSITGF
jgi:hypothetical protein